MHSNTLIENKNNFPLELDVEFYQTYDFFLASLCILFYRYTHSSQLTCISNQGFPILLDLNGDLSIADLLANISNAVAIPPEEKPSPDIMLRVGQKETSFLLNIEFNNTNPVPYIKEHLKNLWDIMQSSPDEKISTLSFLASQEKNILRQAHDTAKEPIFNDFIHRIFEKNAKEVPSRIAVAYYKSLTEKETITYYELNKKSNTLASYLRASNIGPDKVVGISITNSISLMTAIFAVLKAHGVVLTLETIENELLHYKLSETRAIIIIADNSTEHLFISRYPEAVIINIDQWKNIKRLETQLGIRNSNTTLEPENLAYIIYTSGTTGEPKGVLIPHLAFTNLLNALGFRHLPDGNIILSNSLSTFDCIKVEMAEMLATRGTFTGLFPEGRFEPDVLARIIEADQITSIKLLPYICDILDFPHNPRLQSIQDLTTMGAKPKEEMMRQLKLLAEERKNTPTPFILRNEIGWTEVTGASTNNAFPHDTFLNHSYTAVGTPNGNTRIYILDEEYNECPIGIKGQIFAEGLSLANGYVNKPELTALKFKNLSYDSKNHRFSKRPLPIESKVPPTKKRRLEKNSFFSPPSSDFMRLYETGDCARRLDDKDGSIDYIDRMSSNRQIKIHGVRIELDGVENRLQEHLAIKESVVTFDSKIERLRGYIVPKDEKYTFTKRDINIFLGASTLPRVAKLASLAVTESFPINANGKVDVKALAELKEISTSFTEGTPLQLQLKEIWERVLHTKIEHIDDAFGQLGGDSLFAAYLSIEIEKAFPDAKIGKLEILANPSIKTLAETIEFRRLTTSPTLSFFTSPPEDNKSFANPFTLTSSFGV